MPDPSYSKDTLEMAKDLGLEESLDPETYAEVLAAIEKGHAKKREKDYYRALADNFLKENQIEYCLPRTDGLYPHVVEKLAALLTSVRDNVSPHWILSQLAGKRFVNPSTGEDAYDSMKGLLKAQGFLK